MIGCVVFNSIDKCRTCDKLHFLSNSICKKVGTLISKCEIYETETVCLRCAKGYQLLQNKCSKTEINSCTTVGYDGICEVCIDNFKVCLTRFSFFI